jgi:hypothetical protein
VQILPVVPFTRALVRTARGLADVPEHATSALFGS